jgi:hypothetical protein
MRIKSHPDGTLPTAGEVWVFGSNEKGIHGAGAARVAHQQFGAKYGVGIGVTGNSYAIPTKDHNIRTLPLSTINEYVKTFIWWATNNPDTEYYLSAVGCGLAGYIDEDIAPMFYPALDNVSYPEQWVPFLKDEE